MLHDRDDDDRAKRTLTVRTYSVPGMTCDTCRKAITGELVKLAEVSEVNVDLNDKTVRVVGEAGDEAIRAAIDEAGYEVVGATS